eukprot:80326-Prorocentrum_minimum.AAC.1
MGPAHLLGSAEDHLRLRPARLPGRQLALRLRQLAPQVRALPLVPSDHLLQLVHVLGERRRLLGSALVRGAVDAAL